MQVDDIVSDDSSGVDGSPLREFVYIEMPPFPPNLVFSGQGSADQV
jgi:hypothetical protein